MNSASSVSISKIQDLIPKKVITPFRFLYSANPEEVFVSIYAPTDVNDFKQSMVSALKMASTKAKALGAEPSLLQKLEHLMAEPWGQICNKDYDTLCLFVSPQDRSILQVDLSIEPSLYVNHSFHILPLVPIIQGMDRHWVLSFDSNAIRLFASSLHRTHKVIECELKLPKLEIDSLPDALKARVTKNRESAIEHHAGLIERSLNAIDAMVAQDKFPLVVNMQPQHYFDFSKIIDGFKHMKDRQRFFVFGNYSPELFERGRQIIRDVISKELDFRIRSDSMRPFPVDSKALRRLIDRKEVTTVWVDTQNRDEELDDLTVEAIKRKFEVLPIDPDTLKPKKWGT